MTLGIVAALALSLNGKVIAQDSDHQMHHTGNEVPEMPQAVGSGMIYENSATDTADDAAQAAMNHDEMNHDEMNHEEMNHDEMNHEADEP